VTFLTTLLVAFGLAAVLAAIDATSRSLVSQCLAAGNTRCVDSGGSGAQALVVAGYAVASWIKARHLVRPF